MKRCAGVFWKSNGGDCLSIIPEQSYLSPSESVMAMPESEARLYISALQQGAVPDSLKYYLDPSLGSFTEFAVNLGAFERIEWSLPANVHCSDEEVCLLSPASTNTQYALSNANIEIPPLSSTAKELLRLQQLEEVDIDELVYWINQDAALSASLLYIVQSPFYSRKKAASTVQQAIVRLGVDRALVLMCSFALSAVLKKHDLDAKSNERAVALAVMSENVAKLTNLEIKPKSAYLVGMMVGFCDLAMQFCYSSVYQTVKNHQELNRHIPAALFDREWLEFSRHDLAAALMRHWSIPDTIVDAVLYGDPISEPVDDNHAVQCLGVAQMLLRHAGHFIYVNRSGPPAMKEYGSSVSSMIEEMQALHMCIPAP